MDALSAAPSTSRPSSRGDSRYEPPDGRRTSQSFTLDEPEPQPSLSRRPSWTPFDRVETSSQQSLKGERSLPPGAGYAPSPKGKWPADPSFTSPTGRSASPSSSLSNRNSMYAGAFSSSGAPPNGLSASAGSTLSARRGSLGRVGLRLQEELDARKDALAASAGRLEGLGALPEDGQDPVPSPRRRQSEGGSSSRPPSFYATTLPPLPGNTTMPLFSGEDFRQQLDANLAVPRAARSTPSPSRNSIAVIGNNRLSMALPRNLPTPPLSADSGTSVASKRQSMSLRSSFPITPPKEDSPARDPLSRSTSALLEEARPPLPVSSSSWGPNTSLDRDFARQSTELPNGSPSQRIRSDTPDEFGSPQNKRASRQPVRTSTIPDFVPAPAFSHNDRGPYPPHPSSTGSIGSLSQALKLGVITSTGLEGPYPGAGPAAVAGTLKDWDPNRTEDLEVDSSAQRAPSSFYRPAVASAPAANPSDGTGSPSPALSGRRGSDDVLGGQILGGGRQSILWSNRQAGLAFAGGTPAMPFSPGSPPTPSQYPISPAVYDAGMTGARLSVASPRRPSFDAFVITPSSPQPPIMASPPQAKMGPSSPPPHLVPQPEICVECMMRDRDMADVDVTSRGVWARESDWDFHEALRLEEDGSQERLEYTSEEGYGSNPGSTLSHRGRPGRSRSGEGPTKRLGRGQPLTAASLKLWTNMNPPASSHRWKTLQQFLATQLENLERERVAREASVKERERADARASESRQSASSVMNGMGGRSVRSSTVLPNGLMVEKIDVRKDEKDARAKSRSRVLEERRGSAQSMYPRQQSPAPSSRSFVQGDQPWMNGNDRRYSSPGLKDSATFGGGGGGYSGHSIRTYGGNEAKFARSSTDLRGSVHQQQYPRSQSPGRASIGTTATDRPFSVWSKFRKSASQSVLSLAPSGSMMDMHLGLSQDKHANYAQYETYPSMSDTNLAIARHQEVHAGDPHARMLSEGVPDSTSQNPKKKKGIKGFFSKLMSGNETKKARSKSVSMPTSPQFDVDYDDDGVLAPPPPLLALVNDPQYHQRSGSSSSVDSFSLPNPYRQSSVPLTSPTMVPMEYSSSPKYPYAADRRSILTTGSLRSRNDGARNSTASPFRSSGDYVPPHERSFLPHDEAQEMLEVSRPVRDSVSTSASLRKEKSLPHIPFDHPSYGGGPGVPQYSPPVPGIPESFSGSLNKSRSMNSFSGLAASDRERERERDRERKEDWDTVGGGRKSKARSRLFSMHLGFNGGGGNAGNAREYEDSAMGDGVMDGIAREGALVSVRY